LWYRDRGGAWGWSRGGNNRNRDRDNFIAALNTKPAKITTMSTQILQLHGSYRANFFGSGSNLSSVVSCHEVGANPGQGKNLLKAASSTKSWIGDDVRHAVRGRGHGMSMHMLGLRLNLWQRLDLLVRHLLLRFHCLPKKAPMKN